MINLQFTAALAVGLFFLCLPALIYAETGKVHPRNLLKVNSNPKRHSSSTTDGKPLYYIECRPILTLTFSRSIVALAWRNSIVFGPGHQNPVEAVVPIPMIENSTLTFDHTYSLNPRNLDLQSLHRRDALRCDSAPCVDERFEPFPVTFIHSS